MAKVFRLHKGEEGSGWFHSQSFNDEHLKTILTDGKEVSNSIPSPFARIDLVKEAFRWVALNEIEGKTAQHKLVSEALDIGQLFFNSEMFKKDIEIIEYNPRERIKSKFNDENSKHNDFASTLNVYWEQDGNVYNFDRVNRLYFILYKKELIGSTSPASLFISAPFDDNIRKDISIQRASGKYFGKEPVSLANREWDYILYLFLLAKQPFFADYFPSVFEYLEKVKGTLSADKRRQVNELSAELLLEYTQCHVTGEPTNFCKVVDIPLHIAKKRNADIENQSDFVIVSDFPIEGRKPLVLPNSTFSEKWTFTTSDVKWNPDEYNGKIPDKNIDLSPGSRLPIHNDEYPWLSAGNFLANKIIEVPYEINSDKFVTGDGSNGRKYLLPITETFLKYFDTENVSKMLKIEEYSQGTVIAKLNVKTKGGTIKFEKQYRVHDKLKLELHLAILPFVQVEQSDIPIEYTIGIIDGDFNNNINNNLNIRCYRHGELLALSSSVIRSPGKPTAKSKYQKTNKYFDAVQIIFNGKESGFVIPKMKEYSQSNETCKFAIDFGTTNTHIEYKVGTNAEKAFDILSSNTLWASLFSRKSTKELTEDEKFSATHELTFERELMPITIGGDSNGVSFPLRTALVENKKNISAELKLEVFKQVNNYLLYEHMPEGSDLSLHTNLKWEDLHKNINVKRLEAYIEYLIRLIKYKSLTLNISLSNVKITWFYPVSMSKYHRGRLSEVWNSKLNQIFSQHFNTENIRSIPESIGPYYYYYKKRAITGLTLSVDIGGGSTDVSVYNEGQVKFITSFRFAGDAIYGDGYGKDPSRNGFVNLFKDIAYTYVSGNSDIYPNILRDILESKESSKDFSSYLFAHSNKISGFDYPTLIKNHKSIKLVILLFHASIAYYIAKMMDNEGYDMPENLLFSGSAAKSVYFLDSDELDQISDLYRFFFKKVLKSSAIHEISCHISPIPKEITCKGGILSEDIRVIDYKKIFWLGGRKEFDKNIDLGNLTDSPDFSGVLKGDIISFEEEINYLYEIIDEYSDQTNLEKSFGISREAYSIFKNKRGKKIIEELKRGVKLNIEEQHSSMNEPIEDTLFFFPLIGEISRLAFELSKSKK